MTSLHETRTISNKTLGGGYRMLLLEAPEVVSDAKPGQFIHLRIPNVEPSALRRPFSICDAHEGILSILYNNVGRGTESMGYLRAGDTVNIMGPIGNGFPSPARSSLPLLVAGGYGVAPLYFLAKNSKTKGILFAGGRSAEDVLLIDFFKDIGWDTQVSTDDGSLGVKGFVTAALDSWQSLHPATKIEMFACGPEGMLAAVDARAIRWGAKAWISLDRRMGCAVGACLGCVQKMKRNTESGIEETYIARVCQDGPVFESGTIVWGN